MFVVQMPCPSAIEANGWTWWPSRLAMTSCSASQSSGNSAAPESSRCSSMRWSQEGSQPQPASMYEQRSRGNRSKTPCTIIESEAASTILAGIIGTLFVAGVGYGAARLTKREGDAGASQPS